MRWAALLQKRRTRAPEAPLPFEHGPGPRNRGAGEAAQGRDAFRPSRKAAVCSADELRSTFAHYFCHLPNACNASLSTTRTRSAVSSNARRTMALPITSAETGAYRLVF